MKELLWDVMDHKVVKANSLIQKSRFNLSAQEQKIILYLISKIKKDDMEFLDYAFGIPEFCRVCGIDDDNGKNYKNLKDSLQGLRNKSVWVTLPNGDETTLGWLGRATISRRNGTVVVRIDELMKPFLLYLRDCFTQYELYNVIAMDGKYSSRIYELLKSYEFRKEPIPIELEDLKNTLFATHYKQYNDFKRFVLEPAMREINELTDITMSYEAKATPGKGKGITKIVFHVKRKDVAGRSIAFANIEKRLSPKELPGQISLATPSDLIEEGGNT